MHATEARAGLTFPRSSRLRRSSDFRRVQGRGYKIRRPSLLGLWLPRRDHPVTRVGLTVSKKVGNAVARNRVKRWLREAVRHELDQLTRPVDVVLIAHPRAADASAEGLRAEVRGAFRDLMQDPPRKRTGGRRKPSASSGRAKSGKSRPEPKAS
jgi:ribonuclease P protein component